MENYFNALPHRLKVQELGKCDFMQNSAFVNGVKPLIGKKNCNYWMWCTRFGTRSKS